MSPPADIKDYLSYDPESGKFIWIKKPRKRTRVGDDAGLVSHRYGYARITFRGKSYLAHRLAWWWVHGRMPQPGTDHINGRPADNRICNLRECNQRQNNCNHAGRRNRASRFRGVSLHSSGLGWIAQITQAGTYRYLGFFRSEEEAARTYDAAALKYFGTFAHLNFPKEMTNAS